MRPTPLLAMLAAIALLFAACGDDDDTSTATDDTTEQATETETEESAGDDADSDDDVAFGGDLGECGFLAGFATAFEDYDPSTIYSGGEATDFGQIFAPLAEAAQDVADAAPEEIRDAFRTMADGFTVVAEELEGVCSTSPIRRRWTRGHGQAREPRHRVRRRVRVGIRGDRLLDRRELRRPRRPFDLDSFGS